MDPLSITASIIAVLQVSATVLGYLNDVKDASKDRARCAVEASDLHSLLVNLRFRLEEEDCHQPWYTSIQALGIRNGPLDQFEQALETLQTKMTDGGRIKRVGDALIWRFKREEIDRIMARMDRLKTLVITALQMDHFKLSQAIKDDTDSTRMHVHSIQSGMNTVRQNQDLTRQRIFLEWISPTDYPAKQSDIIKRRQGGTGQWFLDAPEVASWLEGANASLFCPGMPGAGKTMMAAITIDHLLNSNWNSSYGLAFVYCDYKAQGVQDITSMLAAILKQLLQGRPSTFDYIEKLQQRQAIGGIRPSLDEIYSALRDVLAHYSTVYIVIDALDECKDHDGTRHQFLTKLQDLRVSQDIRLMVTSRFIPEIMDAFKDSPRLEVQASNDDVKHFVAGQTYRLSRCIQKSSALQEMVQDKIVEAADGMFLLARLHTDSLLDKRTVKEVKSTLSKLFKGAAALDDAYGEALRRIDGQLDGDRELAKKVLSWITFAKRPLTTAEICCALAVEPGEEELDPQNMLDVEDLVSVCAGLVVVDPESAIIRLVHHTMQEYFERVHHAWYPAGQLQIAVTCLEYLSFSAFRNGSCSTDEEFEERLQQNQFLDYAAKHGGSHIKAVECEVSSQTCSFLLQPGLLLNIAQVLTVPDYQYKGYSQSYSKITALHYTAQFGLSIVAGKILSSSEEPVAETVNIKDSWGKAPLLWAAKRGQRDIAELLLNNGADINARGGFYGNALQVASSGGYEAVVKLLLDKGAKLNMQDEDSNMLQTAAASGHELIVMALLNKFADVNAQGGFYGSALQAASAEGHELVVKRLLDRGADVNAEGGFYGNSIQAASARGYKSILKLLLDKGAKVDVQGGYYGNALQAASAAGNKSIAKLLLARGKRTDIDMDGGRYGSALQAASARGHKSIVKLLLNTGVDMEAQNGRYGNALCAASATGNESIVRLLLKAGADINAWSALYGNALCAASTGGHESVVKFLISRGISFEAENHHGETAASLSAFRGELAILQRILSLSKGNIYAPDRYGRTLLWWAAAGGQVEVVEALTSQYAFDSQVADKFGRAPIWIAARKGHDAVTKILSKECREDDIAQIVPLEDQGDDSNLECDICTSKITVTALYYHCGICAGGDWDMCEDCELRGASCSGATHVLLKRMTKNGVAVDVKV